MPCACVSFYGVGVGFSGLSGAGLALPVASLKSASRLAAAGLTVVKPRVRVTSKRGDHLGDSIEEPPNSSIAAKGVFCPVFMRLNAD